MWFSNIRSNNYFDSKLKAQVQSSVSFSVVTQKGQTRHTESFSVATGSDLVNSKSVSFISGPWNFNLFLSRLLEKALIMKMVHVSMWFSWGFNNTRFSD